MLNCVLALLVKYTDLTADEATHISEELSRSIKPSRYADAETLVTNIMAKLDKK